jgi:hypothetical protein
MTTALLGRTVALGALTGMRSMAGLTILARGTGGVLPGLLATAAAGEMVADTTSVVGDRVDALPLTGRAVLGALAGGIVAHQEQGNVLLGAMVGATAAVIVTHLAYRIRTRMPVSGVVGGVLEDGLVVGLGALYSRYAASARGRQ